MGLLQAITRLFIGYGYFFLFFAAALENIPVIGIFLPGEVVVVAAGFFAAQGNFSLAAVIIIAGAGAMIGTICSYAIGFWGGRPLIEMLASKLRVDGRRIKDADDYFSTHGHITVFVGRYLTGIKAFIPALAGAHRMRFFNFVLFAALGVATWTVLAASLGYFFGANWAVLIGIVKTAGWLLLLLALILVGSVWYWRRRR